MVKLFFRMPKEISCEDIEKSGKSIQIADLSVSIRILSNLNFRSFFFIRSMNKTVLITGASQGIGKITALKFRNYGYNVIACARNISNSTDLIKSGIDVYDMDISKSTNIDKAFHEIYMRYQQIDILVNNAGFSQNGFLEELTRDQIRYQFEVNVFGLINVTQKVLPLMRKIGLGKIINVGSMGGDFTSPGASAYHASKYALESFTDGLRQELKTFGIAVVMIKPGGVATNFTNNSRNNFPKPIEGNPYGKQRLRYNAMLDTILDTEKGSVPLLAPEDVADVIIEIANHPNPKTKYRIGMLAKIMPVLKSLMSDHSFDKMLSKQLKLNE